MRQNFQRWIYFLVLTSFAFNYIIKQHYQNNLQEIFYLDIWLQVVGVMIVEWRHFSQKKKLSFRILNCKEEVEWQKWEMAYFSDLLSGLQWHIYPQKHKSSKLSHTLSPTKRCIFRCHRLWSAFLVKSPSLCWNYQRKYNR